MSVPARASSGDAKCSPVPQRMRHHQEDGQNCSRSNTLPLLQKKVAQKRDGGEQPVAGKPAWHTSRCCPRRGIFIVEFGSHKAAWSWVNFTPGLQCDIRFSPALVAFQVTIKAGQPRRWACARLCWSLSHTRFLVPRSHDCTQLLC